MKSNSKALESLKENVSQTAALVKFVSESLPKYVDSLRESAEFLRSSDSFNPITIEKLHEDGSTTPQNKEQALLMWKILRKGFADTIDQETTEKAIQIPYAERMIKEQSIVIMISYFESYLSDLCYELVEDLMPITIFQTRKQNKLKDIIRDRIDAIRRMEELLKFIRDQFGVKTTITKEFNDVLQRRNMIVHRSRANRVKRKENKDKRIPELSNEYVQDVSQIIISLAGQIERELFTSGKAVRL